MVHGYLLRVSRLVHLELIFNADVLAVAFLHLVACLLRVRAVNQLFLLLLRAQQLVALVVVHLLLIVIVKVPLHVHQLIRVHDVFSTALLLLVGGDSSARAESMLFMIRNHLVLLVLRLRAFVRIIVVHFYF